MSQAHILVCVDFKKKIWNVKKLMSIFLLLQHRDNIEILPRLLWNSHLTVSMLLQVMYIWLMLICFGFFKPIKLTKIFLDLAIFCCKFSHFEFHSIPAGDYSRLQTALWTSILSSFAVNANLQHFGFVPGFVLIEHLYSFLVLKPFL